MSTSTPISPHRAVGCSSDFDADAVREAARAYPPILLAIPCVDWMWSTAVAAITLLSHMLPPGSRLQFMPETYSSISYKRTMIARTLLASPELHAVLMVDSDMDPPADAALRLLSHDLDIVSALYCQRQQPYGLSAAMLEGRAPPTIEERQRPVAVAGVGFGCVLIKRHVFEAVPAPWFADEPNTPGLSEDYWFCHRARACGFTVHLDCLLECGHVGTTSLTPDFSRVWQATPDGQRARARAAHTNHAAMLAAQDGERAAHLAINSQHSPQLTRG
jgi:hypothetical protein